MFVATFGKMPRFFWRAAAAAALLLPPVPYAPLEAGDPGAVLDPVPVPAPLLPPPAVWFVAE